MVVLDERINNGQTQAELLKQQTEAADAKHKQRQQNAQAEINEIMKRREDGQAIMNDSEAE